MRNPHPTHLSNEASNLQAGAPAMFSTRGAGFLGLRQFDIFGPQLPRAGRAACWPQGRSQIGKHSLQSVCSGPRPLGIQDSHAPQGLKGWGNSSLNISKSSTPSVRGHFRHAPASQGDNHRWGMQFPLPLHGRSARGSREAQRRDSAGPEATTPGRQPRCAGRIPILAGCEK